MSEARKGLRMGDENCCVGYEGVVSCRGTRLREVFKTNTAVHKSSLRSSSNLTFEALMMLWYLALSESSNP